MATDADVAAHVVEQLQGAGLVHVRKMFGEYAVYCDDKVVAFICDDTLFLKITEPGAALLDSPRLGQPYPGAKDYFVIDDAGIEDADRLVELVRVTAAVLPAPKPRRRKP